MKRAGITLLLALAAFCLALLVVWFAPAAREGFVSHFEAPKGATILFAGDMMFDRSVREYAERYGGDYVFACIDSLLKAPDLVVANLEGPITASSSVSVGSTPGGVGNYTFTFPTSTAALLKAHHIDLVTLGNNHIENFDRSGVEQTIHWLKEANVGYFGDPLSLTVSEQTIRGVPLAFIAYNEFLPPGIGTASTTLSQIRNEREKGYLPIVFAHWGDEYKTEAPPRVVALARQFVDQGAAAVIGSHPHVVENDEVYKGVPIYYSLGNFIFDQYFSPEVKKGLLVTLTFSKDGVVSTHKYDTMLTQDRRVCPAI